MIVFQLLHDWQLLTSILVHRMQLWVNTNNVGLTFNFAMMRTNVVLIYGFATQLGVARGPTDRVVFNLLSAMHEL